MGEVSTISILEKISCPPFTIDWAKRANEFNRIRFWVYREAPDRDDPTELGEFGRHGDLPVTVPDERVVLWTVQQVLHNLATHEVDEFFTYNGELIFDPHDHSR